MASNKSSVIQLNDEQDAQSELQFQDFSLGGSSSGIATLSPTGTYTSFPGSPDTQNVESEDLLGTDKKEESSFWKFSYYQSFFDIETVDFIERLKWSFIPVVGRATFLDRQIRPKPDLYGPFWITFCLIYSTAIMSNLATYFNGAHNERKEWTFNFHRVSMAATIIYSYVFLLPIILWGVLRHFQYSNRYTLLEMICIYGYSLSIFVPISVFWIFDAAWLHWILVIIGIGLTGAVLLQIFWPIFRDDNKKIGTILLCVILALHLLLGVGFGTLFFSQRVHWVSSATVTVPLQTPISIVQHQTSSEALIISRSVPNEKKIKDAIKGFDEKYNQVDSNKSSEITTKTTINDVITVKPNESDVVTDSSKSKNLVIQKV